MKKIITTLFLAATAIASAQNDSVKVFLKLKSINDVLTFNQPHVNANDLEYAWEVRINTDNNLSTGDSQGFDVGLALVNYKFGSSNSYTGTIISGTDQYTRIYNGSAVSYGNPVNALFNYSDTSIVISAPASLPELSSIHSGQSFHVFSYFNSPTGIQADSLSVSTICNFYSTDIINDVPSSFIDIKAVKISSPGMVGLQTNVSNIEKLRVYPNPCTDKVTIEGKDILSELYDSQGNLTASTSGSEIETTNYPPGVYLLISHSNTQYTTTRLIINK